MRRLAQATGWILLFGIAYISIVPPELRPETVLPHDLEHATIFFLAGCAFGIGYPNGFQNSLLGLTAFTLAIEIAQVWVSGRHARLLDFAVDAVSIGMGLAIGATLARVKRAWPVALEAPKLGRWRASPIAARNALGRPRRREAAEQCGSGVTADLLYELEKKSHDE